MSGNLPSLKDTLVAGLTLPISDVEREAARTPPYSIPAAVVPIRDRVLEELVSRLPSAGDEPPTVTRVLSRPRDYRFEVQMLACSQRLFEFADATCALIAVDALTSDEVDSIAPLLPESCGFRRQQVLNRIAAGDLAGARALATRIDDGYAWRAYRDIGFALADRGDVKGFFADWKRYAAGQDRAGMALLKEHLIAGVARHQDWNAAVTVAANKRIGPSFVCHAFTGFVDAADVDGLWEVLTGAAQGLLPELGELALLAATIRQATPHNPERNHPLLDTVVDRLIAIDPTADKAVMRGRDSELFALWPAIGEQSTLDRVRKAVRTPGYKRELTTLPREMSPSR
ncbi:hypothetical protein [Nocardia rosealba]|uniref:hypothetical protein n=1 Tax=Nocardia rosealba TaxID=2878563 RepID=UPI001CD97DF0|nr:hypothetical protein [Nocardia rosealba]MCA2210910.1 hypothetical protein [Nocardia rosealba]